MSGKEIIQAIKIKLILNKLSKAKEAAMREFLGLPPKQSWTSECLGKIMSCVKDQICHIFCPCCIYDINRQQKRLSCFSSPTFKEFAGFVCGLIITIFSFFILVLQMDVHPRTAFISCAIGSLVLSLLLAFSLNIRCVVIMMVPQFFSGKGRMFLLMYALFLVMNHPVKNIFVNVTVMSQSATCGQEMALNETKDLLKAATAPLEGIMNSVRGVVDKLTQFSKSLRETYMTMSRTIQEIGSTIASAAQWLINITNRCQETMGNPYNQCKEAFREGERKCRKKLGILKALCKGVRALDFVCHVTKVAQAFCFIVDIFKRFIISPVGSGARTVIKSAEDMFYFNVTIDYHYNYSITQSKTYTQIRKDITNEISSYTEFYMVVIDYLRNFLLLTVMFVLIKALIYRYRWLSSDRYDNTYITFTVLDLDQKRKDRGKAGIMPLTYEEEKKYISDASSTMTRKELIKLATGIVLFIFSAFNTGFYLFCDYGLYSVLSLIRKHFGQATKAPIPPHTKLKVVGVGPMADMYRSIVSMFDPIARSHIHIDVTPCVPYPNEPDWNVYRTIGYIYLACLLMTIGEAYALRLRHMIMGCYFPKRERHRAIWLYNHIMKTRGGLMSEARKTIKDRHEGSAVTDQISLKGRLAAMFPILEKVFKFLGWEVKSCLYCGKEGKPDDYVRFIHCSYFDCDAIYCVDCYADLDNICAVCNNAVDMGGSGVSEEIDSSIDVRDKLKLAVQRKLRNEKIQALQAERTTSRVMNRFTSVFGSPNQTAQTSTNQTQQDNDVTDTNRAPVDDDSEESSESEGENPEDQSLIKRKIGNRQNSARRRNFFSLSSNERRPTIRRRSLSVVNEDSLRRDMTVLDQVDESDCDTTCSSSDDSDNLDCQYNKNNNGLFTAPYSDDDDIDVTPYIQSTERNDAFETPYSEYFADNGTTRSPYMSNTNNNNNNGVSNTPYNGNPNRTTDGVPLGSSYSDEIWPILHQSRRRRNLDLVSYDDVYSGSDSESSAQSCDEIDNKVDNPVEPFALVIRRT